MKPFTKCEREILIARLSVSEINIVMRHAPWKKSKIERFYEKSTLKIISKHREKNRPLGAVPFKFYEWETKFKHRLLKGWVPK